MDANTLSENIGKFGVLSILQSSLRVNVKILNAREMWGRVDFLVSPVEGTGTQWVAATRVQIGLGPEKQ